MRKQKAIGALVMALLVSTIFAAVPAGATEVWSSAPIIFSKPDNADFNLPQYQDHITDNVVLTRGQVQGLYNFAVEDVFERYLSPVDTEWAAGSTLDYGTLDYTDWNTYVNANGGPLNVVGLPTVVHLISDDIYIDILMTYWGSQHFHGGFTYSRATAGPVATEENTWGSVKSLFR